MQVCATCFDLSVSLLRVLEMTVTLVPEIFLDWTRPSAELLLRRLAQVIQNQEMHTSQCDGWGGFTGGMREREKSWLLLFLTNILIFDVSSSSVVEPGVKQSHSGEEPV